MKIDCSNYQLVHDLTRMRFLFFALFIIWSCMANYAFGQNSEFQAVIDATQNASLAHVQKEMEQINSDVRALTSTVNELAASINRFVGIGIAIGALGGIIVILQSLQMVQSRKKGA